MIGSAPRRRPGSPLRHPALAVIALALLLVVPAGCSDDDDNPSSPAADGADVDGTWQANTFSADGTDAIAAGMSLTATFNVTSTGLRHAEGTYNIVITNDQLGLCEMGEGADCNPAGPFLAEDGFITFDPEEEGPTVFAYTVTGNTMTFSANIDGTAIAASFTKVS